MCWLHYFHRTQTHSRCLVPQQQIGGKKKNSSSDQSNTALCLIFSLQANWSGGALLIVLHVVQCSQLNHCGGGWTDRQSANRYTNLSHHLHNQLYDLNKDLIATATIRICITPQIMKITTAASQMNEWMNEKVPFTVASVGTTGHVMPTQIYGRLAYWLHLKLSCSVYI